MIARLWHGLTSRENAGAYETLLRNKVLPQIHRVSGYGGAYLLKRSVPEGVEFVTLTFFESLNAVRAFAGSDYEQAGVPPDARAVLKRFDERPGPYQMVLRPDRRRCPVPN